MESQEPHVDVDVDDDDDDGFIVDAHVTPVTMRSFPAPTFVNVSERVNAAVPSTHRSTMDDADVDRRGAAGVVTAADEGDRDDQPFPFCASTTNTYLRTIRKKEKKKRERK
jgi:hypothetical protein